MGLDTGLSNLLVLPLSGITSVGSWQSSIRVAVYKLNMHMFVMFH